MRERLAQAAASTLSIMEQIDALKREQKSLGIFNFKGRREIKRRIKELEKQEDSAFRSLERISTDLM